ncbi:MAG: histidine--tRNA ligase [Candidatus Aenigmatarchaeota archaeon]|nr:MAG: histidine--tRNA ligase [Candidatus Aenigmarchaeota archaeon]
MGRFQPPRGTRDFMPDDMVRREYIFGKVRSVFERFGFRPMETPAFESWDLLGAKGGGGDAIKDEIYLFRDKGKRQMGLRFVLTVPASRVVATNPQLPKPFKRYQIGRVWRYDKPQAGRFREFWQSDIDVFGSSGMEAEAECIATLVAAIESLGFKGFEVRLNNRKILNGMVRAAGVNKGKSEDVFRSLDKIEKQGESKVRKELCLVGIDDSSIDKLMRMIGISGKPAEALASARRELGKDKEAAEGINELEDVVSLSKAYGVRNIVIDFGLVRGLDYYTGPIYEIKAKTKTSVGSIAGGGRYDKLIELYGGPPTPATGGSIGVERVYEILCAEGMLDLPSTATRVFIAMVGDNPEVKRNAIQLSQKLRAMGVAVETDLMDRKLKQCFEYAEKAGIPYMIIMGEKEMKEGRLVLKDLKKREQKRLTVSGVIKELK